MSDNFRELNDLFKSSFEDFRIEPSKYVWDNISRKLWFTRFFRYSFQTFNVYYFTGIVTASIIGSIMMFNNPAPENMANQTEEQNSICIDNTEGNSHINNDITEQTAKSAGIKGCKTDNITARQDRISSRRMTFNNDNKHNQQFTSVNNNISTSEINLKSETGEDNSQLKTDVNNVAGGNVALKLPEIKQEPDKQPSFEIINPDPVNQNIVSDKEYSSENGTIKEQDVIIYDTIRIHVYDTVYTYDTVNYRPVEKNNNAIFSLEAFVAPVISSCIFKTASNEFKSDLRKLENATSSNSGFSIGLNAGYQYKNWLLQTGLTYSQINEDFNDTLITNISDSISYYEYYFTGHHELDTAYFTFIWDPDDSLYILVPYLHDTFITDLDSAQNWQTYNNTTRRFYNNLNKYTYLEIPVSLGYEFKYQRFSIIPRIGGIIGILLNAKGRSISFYDHDALIELDKNKLPFLKTTFSWMVGLGINYRFNDHFSLITEPFFKQNLNSIYTNRHPFSQRFSTAGLRAGLKYEF